MDGREDRGQDADPECEAQDAANQEGGPPGEQAQGKAQVQEKARHGFVSQTFPEKLAPRQSRGDPRSRLYAVDWPSRGHSLEYLDSQAALF